MIILLAVSIIILWLLQYLRYNVTHNNKDNIYTAMRIIHTSDWHLGQYFYGKSRANEHQQFLNWLLAQVTKHKVDALIVAGDIFDTGTPPSYAREMYFDFIAKITQLSCQLILLAGNHDSVAMLAESKQLLASLAVTVMPTISANIEEQVIAIKNKQGQPEALLCAIPFIRPRDVLTSQAGQSAKTKQQNLQQAISKHYQASYKHALAYRASLENKIIPIIATGHLTTVGVTTSESVRDIYIGTLEAYPASAFPPADYIALGHIHKAQKVAKSEHIRYCGSPIALSFDEAKQEKQVLLVDFEDDKFQQTTALTVPTFQPLAMVKTSLEQLVHDVEQLVVQQQTFLADNKNAKVWLDIEIESADYLQDLQAKINHLIEDLPIEILLVRRSKKARRLMTQSEDKTTLSELTLAEVFDKRLDVEMWQTAEQLAQKKRITDIFQKVAFSLDSLAVVENAKGEDDKTGHVKAGLNK